MKIRIALSTAPDLASAHKIVRTLVEEELVACGNIVPAVTSIFRWKGSVDESGEVLMIFKFAEAGWDGLKKRLPELHPYEVPELVLLEVRDGLSPYLDWVGESTKRSKE